MSALDAAIASISSLISGLTPEERYEWKTDLRQNLLVKLWDGRLRDEPAGIKLAAKNETSNMLRRKARTRKLEHEYSSGIRKTLIARRGPAWIPTWYPPAKGAEEFAPFLCHGARIMHVKAFSGSRTSDDSHFETPGIWGIEDALAEIVDSEEKVKINPPSAVYSKWETSMLQWKPYHSRVDMGEGIARDARTCSNDECEP